MSTITMPLPESDHRLTVLFGRQIVSIDQHRHQVIDDQGRHYSYRQLVLATGAEARRLMVPGAELAGVHYLRTLQDALALREQLGRARRVVVVGGGVLGAETVAALAPQLDTLHWVVREERDRVAHRLGADGAAQLALLMQHGVIMHTGVAVAGISGQQRLQSLRLTDGGELRCDVAVLAIGVQPNTSLARDAGLDVETGIVVNEQLLTSDPHIYAIGDCAEFQRQTQGTVQPGLQQAELVASALNGETIRYQSEHAVVQAKVSLLLSMAAHSGDAALTDADDPLICQCNQVRRTTIEQAMQQGHTCLASLQQVTGASGNCGACRPLLQDLLGNAVVTAAPQGWRYLQAIALITVLTGLTYLLLPGLAYQDAVVAGIQWDSLWRDPLSRQITGFSLLAISLTVSVLGLRKRVRRFYWGDYRAWRNAHLILGLLIMVTLLIHTGARSGNNLDSWLMYCFIAVLLSGGLLVGSIANEHRVSTRVARCLRVSTLWLHLLALWPLPALLLFHVFKSYYF